jgi:hypothetical protein
MIEITRLIPIKFKQLKDIKKDVSNYANIFYNLKSLKLSSFISLPSKKAFILILLN